MSNELNIPIYINIAFDTPQSTADLKQLSDYVEDLKRSGFTTAIMFALHIDQQGNFTFGDPTKNPPMVVDGILQSGYSHLSELLWQMKYEGEMKTGVTINKLMFCLGGAGCESDYTNVGNLIKNGTGNDSPLYKNFKVLRDELYVEAIDVDLESGYTPELQKTVVQLTQLLSGPGDNALNMETTYCPYDKYHVDFWLGCLADVYQANNKQLVSWWNLQCYDGGKDNAPEKWVECMTNYPSELGIDSPGDFIIPGYWCVNPTLNPKCQPNHFEGAYCPNELQTKFDALTKSDSGIRGGFIWSYAGILACLDSNECGGQPLTTSAYAQAIKNGLSQANG